MRVLELFSGNGNISKAMQSRGHETFTVDNDSVHFTPDLCVDIMDLDVDTIIDVFDVPHVIWCSPPCQCFSVASMNHHWAKPFIPITSECKKSIVLVKHTLDLIKELNPIYWFMENPMGMLRKMDFMKYPIRTVTYCQYGDFRMKPTDIWGRFPESMIWLKCKNGDPCHETARRVDKAAGTFSLKTSIERANIPKFFCDLIALACEHDYRRAWSLSANDVRTRIPCRLIPSNDDRIDLSNPTTIIEGNVEHCAVPESVRQLPSRLGRSSTRQSMCRLAGSGGGLNV